MVCKEISKVRNGSVCIYGWFQQTFEHLFWQYKQIGIIKVLISLYTITDNLTYMSTFYPAENSPALQAMSKFDQDLKRLEKEMQSLQTRIEPLFNPQGFQAVDCTQTESVQIEPESRKSIIDDLEIDILKQTSHTNYTNQLTAMNYIFEIKEETEIDQISMGTSRRQFNLFGSQREMRDDEIVQPEPPISLQPSVLKIRNQRPKSASVKLKDLMVHELKRSNVIETINFQIPKRISNNQIYIPPLNHNSSLGSYTNNRSYIKINNVPSNQNYFPARKHIIYTPIK